MAERSQGQLPRPPGRRVALSGIETKCNFLNIGGISSSGIGKHYFCCDQVIFLCHKCTQRWSRKGHLIHIVKKHLLSPLFIAQRHVSSLIFTIPLPLKRIYQKNLEDPPPPGVQATVLCMDLYGRCVQIPNTTFRIIKFHSYRGFLFPNPIIK